MSRNLLTAHRAFFQILCDVAKGLSIDQAAALCCEQISHQFALSCAFFMPSKTNDSKVLVAQSLLPDELVCKIHELSALELDPAPLLTPAPSSSQWQHCQLTANATSRYIHQQLQQHGFSESWQLTLNTGPATNTAVLLIAAFEPLAHASYIDEIFSLCQQVLNAALIANAERQRLQDAATLDFLTGIANRRALRTDLARMMAQSQRQKQPIALFFIDIDDFKQVNDHYGHDVGDQVLIQLARKLQSRCRAMDIVARYGGDEFVMACPIKHNEDAEVISTRLYLSLKEAILTQSIAIRASIGCVIWQPDKPQTIEELMALADQSMYQQKTEQKPNTQEPLTRFTLRNL
ncbi:hypothetical protein VST7929_02851 [Vibrio stylophorae]|uniref:diguanylate cyclase n=1 Tax=Vibrio stylophorae TaxID=659351 RepID=A0ABM8ZX26_9VIBR|nr:GGDEF domain-containing protein [Vibrio stylophorae]CAH0535190.1 hypothetical protein VST7929_02851 [Vibrio stylophorae]